MNANETRRFAALVAARAVSEALLENEALSGHVDGADLDACREAAQEIIAGLLLVSGAKSIHDTRPEACGIAPRVCLVPLFSYLSG